MEMRNRWLWKGFKVLQRRVQGMKKVISDLKKENLRLTKLIYRHNTFNFI